MPWSNKPISDLLMTKIYSDMSSPSTNELMWLLTQHRIKKYILRINNFITSSPNSLKIFHIVSLRKWYKIRCCYNTVQYKPMWVGWLRWDSLVAWFWYQLIANQAIRQLQGHDPIHISTEISELDNVVLDNSMSWTSRLFQILNINGVVE